MARVKMVKVKMLRSCIINGGESAPAGSTQRVPDADANYLFKTGKAEPSKTKLFGGKDKPAAPSGPIPIADIEDLKDAWVGLLQEAGIEDSQEIQDLGTAGLVEIDGIGEATAEKILTVVEAL